MPKVIDRDTERVGMLNSVNLLIAAFIGCQSGIVLFVPCRQYAPGLRAAGLRSAMRRSAPNNTVSARGKPSPERAKARTRPVLTESKPLDAAAHLRNASTESQGPLGA